MQATESKNSMLATHRLFTFYAIYYLSVYMYLESTENMGNFIRQ